MALTKSFKELVHRRAASDADFAESLLREGIDTMLIGDVETGQAMLRDYINATIGFEKLGEATDNPANSLILGYLQGQAGIELHVPLQPR